MNTRTVFKFFLVTALSLLICTGLSLGNASFNKVSSLGFHDHIVLASENKITTANLNLRTGPGTGYPIILTIPKGATVSVIGYSGSWSKLTYNEKTGYSSSSYLTNATTPPVNTSGTRYVTTANLNLRTGPGTGYSIILTIPRGATVSILDSSGSWFRVNYNGKTGYASSSYLTSQASPPSNPSGTEYVTTANLNLRNGPGTSYAIILTLPMGKPVTVSSISNNWANLTYNGIAGYASATYLRSTVVANPLPSTGPTLEPVPQPTQKAKILFTFDDGDINNLIIAAPILQQKGFSGTAYVGRDIPVQYWSPGKMSESDLDKLYSTYGWDLSNHTLNHLTIGSNTDEASLQTLRQEYESNQNWLLSNGWVRGAYHAAYPFGRYSDSLASILKSIGIKTARSTISGLQTLPLNSPYRLLCIDIANLANVKSKIDIAVSDGSTIILMIHGVSSIKNDYTVSTEDFQAVVDYVAAYVQKSQLDVMTISEWYKAIQ
ncbi:MAG: SH3 domain-containing protein [Clostridiaceae bacterium]